MGNKAKKLGNNKDDDDSNSDSDNFQKSNMMITKNKPDEEKSGSESEEEPDEFDVTNPDGSVTKMISTASGPIPLDFSNTKIIQDGKVFNINDLNAVGAPTSVTTGQ